MDIKKSFTTSFEQLRKNKIVVVPILISLIVPLVLVIMYLYISGFYYVFVDAVYLIDEFDSAKAEHVFTNYNLSNANYWGETISYFSGRGRYRNELAAYLEANGIFDDIFKLFNVNNIIIGIFVIVLWLVLSVYLESASYAAIMLTSSKRKVSYQSVTVIANKFWLRIISAKILLLILIATPIVLAALPILLLTSIVWLEIIMIFAFLAFLVFYIIFTGVKFLFVYPLMFYEDLSSVVSIRKSFNITKNNFKQLLIVFGIIYGISTTALSIGITPLFESFYNLVLSESIIISLVIFLLILFFLLIGSFVTAFERMFLFYSYLNYKSSNLKAPKSINLNVKAKR